MRHDRDALFSAIREIRECRCSPRIEFRENFFIGEPLGGTDILNKLS